MPSGCYSNNPAFQPRASAQWNDVLSTVPMLGPTQQWTPRVSQGNGNRCSHNDCGRCPIHPNVIASFNVTAPQTNQMIPYIPAGVQPTQIQNTITQTLWNIGPIQTCVSSLVLTSKIGTWVQHAPTKKSGTRMDSHAPTIWSTSKQTTSFVTRQSCTKQCTQACDGYGQWLSFSWGARSTTWGYIFNSQVLFASRNKYWFLHDSFFVVLFRINSQVVFCVTSQVVWATS